MDDRHNDLELHEDIVASIVLDGDLSELSNGQLVAYYYHRCALLNINPGEKPFELLKLDGKLQLYFSKAGAAALTRVNRLNVEIVNRDMIDGLCIHDARVTDPTGRVVDDVGAVDIEGLKGKNLANAIMKSATKAKRRAVISACGQGILDESELDGMPDRAERVDFAAINRQASAGAPALSAAPSRVAASCRSLRIAISALTGTPHTDIWVEACKRAHAPAHHGKCPEPEQLSDECATEIAAILARWLEQAKSRPVIEPDILDEDPTAAGAP